jgi:hypothetical protein
MVSDERSRDVAHVHERRIILAVLGNQFNM